MTTPFWLNDPTILLNKNELYQIWPNTDMSLEQKLNSISRLVIILSLFGYLRTEKGILFNSESGEINQVLYTLASSRFIFSPCC